MPQIVKKLSISAITVIVIFGALEMSSRIAERRAIKNFPPMPDIPEKFGDFNGFLEKIADLGKVQGYVVREGGIDYAPHTVTSLKPNFPFSIKNVDYRTNSLGFRHGEIVVPKPRGTFRIFILGGSTVQGIFNEQWTVSHYLEEELRKTNPEVEVINAGVVGYMSQNEIALLLTRIIDLEPDLVVVFDGRNDLYYSILPSWQDRKGQDYASHKALLDALVNNPTPKAITGYAAKFFTKQSSFLTRAFRFLFRGGSSPVYPPDARIKEEAIATYLGNLELMKSILETRGVYGVLAFQPTLGYCKDATTPYEESIVRYLRDTEKSDWLEEVSGTWEEVGGRVDRIPDSRLVTTRDLGCLFEDMKETAYIDSVHYAPAAYAVIGKEFAKIITTAFLGR